jgi:hypothetical protein
MLVYDKVLVSALFGNDKGGYLLGATINSFQAGEQRVTLQFGQSAN